MTGRQKALTLAAVLPGLAGVCVGHGLSAERVEGGTGVRVVYDDGAAVAFSDVRVFAPGNDTHPTLTGTTDRNGCFLFLPDAIGTWKVSVEDGMGHAITREIVFDGQVALPVAGPGAMPREYAVWTGLSTIFGLFGWSAYIRLKQAVGKRR